MQAARGVDLDLRQWYYQPHHNLFVAGKDSRPLWFANPLLVRSLVNVKDIASYLEPLLLILLR